MRKATIISFWLRASLIWTFTKSVGINHFSPYKKDHRTHIEWTSGNKVHRRTVHEGPAGEWRFSSTLSLTSVLEGVGG